MIFGKKSSDSSGAGGDVEQQNKVLREALQFYADAKNWTPGHKYRDADDATIFTDGSVSAVTLDKGKVASRALEECKSGK